MTAQAELFAPAPDLTPQQAQTLRLLRENGGLTAREAMMAGIGRLSGRVLELRELGYRIHTLNEKHDGGNHARYTLSTNEVAA